MCVSLRECSYREKEWLFDIPNCIPQNNVTVYEYLSQISVLSDCWSLRKLMVCFRRIEMLTARGLGSTMKSIKENTLNNLRKIGTKQNK